MLKNRTVLGAVIGYGIAIATTWLIPEFISLLLPVLGIAVGATLDRRRKPNISERVFAEMQLPAIEPGQSEPTAASNERVLPPVEVNPLFHPALEYLEVLEDMIISEGQKNNLDNELVEKSLSVFTRLQRVIPLVSELNNDDVNHRLRRLVLKDLNSFISPFLRLSGEAKTQNRRMLLNGLKDIDSDISSIVTTIEHKDLVELQTRAELIHRRYSGSERF
ncbi:hypothetical protein [Paenibacillus eucommiae]|uniref:5-bromo-4-chloroindolyl phosphate hydrolysis protein n=1 Tax=Paenibacillus eucommiae TaxID=1355755 RepID=A0ABS4ITM4_9BACL|nr:hypothetical protein [Paenibacillus eucommiae]MBP1990868.1 hypothetical protein [Paenibacillus eucommiae]